jgi:hypothetical protein
MNKRLLPDPENMNHERAEWAALALNQFQRITGADDDYVLADLLCDLMHWCNRNDVNFKAVLSRAWWHYEAETAAEPADAQG